MFHSFRFFFSTHFLRCRTCCGGLNDKWHYDKINEKKIGNFSLNLTWMTCWNQKNVCVQFFKSVSETAICFSLFYHIRNYSILSNQKIPFVFKYQGGVK